MPLEPGRGRPAPRGGIPFWVDFVRNAAQLYSLLVGRAEQWFATTADSQKNTITRTAQAICDTTSGVSSTSFQRSASKPCSVNVPCQLDEIRTVGKLLGQRMQNAEVGSKVLHHLLDTQGRLAAPHTVDHTSHATPLLLVNGTVGSPVESNARPAQLECVGSGVGGDVDRGRPTGPHPASRGALRTADRHRTWPPSWPLMKSYGVSR